jgi:xanthine dehydrogenase YagR molybdenum-binding subunit
VRFDLGDSAEPPAPVAGASQTTASVAPAVAEAARQLRAALLQAAAADPQSSVHGTVPGQLELRDGMVVSATDASRKEAASDVLARMPQTQLAAEASAKLEDEAKHRMTFHSFGAHFAEVEVDQDLREVRVTRWASVMDVGSVVNAKTARSQIIGGITFGIGMAPMEQTVYDPRNGAPVNNNLADYLVPTCCDVPEFDIVFLNFPDTAFNPLGVRG